APTIVCRVSAYPRPDTALFRAETALTHVLTEADEGATLRIVATSSDSDGSGTSATSTATAAITDIAPTLSTPVISGTTQEGSTLNATATRLNAPRTTTAADAC